MRHVKIKDAFSVFCGAEQRTAMCMSASVIAYALPFCGGKCHTKKHKRGTAQFINDTPTSY
jgi:hypothetical protein